MGFVFDSVVINFGVFSRSGVSACCRDLMWLALEQAVFFLFPIFEGSFG